MKTKRSRKFQFITSLLLSIISGVLLFISAKIPFGLIFNFELLIFALSTIWFFGLLAVMSFKSEKKIFKISGIIPLIISILILSLTVILKTDYKILYFKGLTPKPTSQQWAEDLQFLKDKMTEKHPGLFELVEKESFDREFSESIQNISKLSEREIIMELFKLTSLPNDAHTFPFIMFPCFDLHTYPVQVYLFDDGLTIIDAGREHKDLIGSKILKIGSKTPEEIFNTYPLALSAECEQGKKQRFTYMVLISEWLYYNKLIDESLILDLTVQNNEETKNIRLKPMNFYPHFIWSSIRTIENNSAPVFSNPRENNYRFEYMDGSKTIYFQFNQCVPQNDKESVEETVSRLDEFVKKNEFERFIIDLRNNDGGQEMWMPLFEFLKNNEKINKKGKLFVLTGRKTFSSAVLFANLMQMQTNAVFIGEETGQGPSFYAGPELIELPNSRMVIAISTRKVISGFPFDNRKTLSPDVHISYTSDDFNSGNDPVLEYTLNYKPLKDTAISFQIEDTDQYTGRYLYNEFYVFDISCPDNKLFATFSDFLDESLIGFRSVLRSDSNNIFHSDRADIKFEFSNKNNGVYDLLTCYFYSDTIQMIRAVKSFKTAFELFSEGQYITGCNLIKKDSKRYKENFSDLERKLNTLGYQLMGSEDLKSALAVFKLNTTLFPESSNVYDSYGEALLKNEEREEAIRNYKKSLELNPNNENAKKVLEESGVEY